MAHSPNKTLAIRSAAALALFVSAAAPAAADEPPPRPAPTETLAVRLAGEGDYHGAAIEFRRLALKADRPEARAGFAWASAFEYLRAGDPAVSDKLLDEAEDAHGAFPVPLRLLRARNAADRGDRGAAEFYLEGAIEEAAEDRDACVYAVRRLAALDLRDGRPDDAEHALARSPAAEDRARESLERYRAGSDRSPTVGGLLGLVPGLGYAYSGEFANALRSLLLNGLFLYGAWDQADRENWGAVAVIGFFELTWYSGSVYGGIDAAHRYNRDRLDEAVEGIAGGADFEPDYQVLPVVRLRYVF